MKKTLLITILIFCSITNGFSWLESGDDYEQAADYIFKDGDYYKTAKICKAGLEIRPNSVRLLNTLGQSLFYLKKYDKSKEVFTTILKIAENTKDPKIFSLAYNNLSEIQRVKGNWSQALALLDRSLRLNKKSSYFHGTAINYYNYGRIYKARKNYDQAQKYFNLSLGIKTQFNDNLGIGLILNEKALILEIQGKLKESQKHYQESIEYFSKAQSSYFLGIANGNLGRVYFLRKDDEKALIHLNKAIGYGEKINDYRGIAVRCVHLSMLYIREGDYEEAKKYFTRSLKIRIELGESNLEKEKAFLAKLVQLSKKKQ